MQTVTVNLHERSYPIYVGRNILSNFAEVYSNHHQPQRLVIVTDRNVAPHYLRQLSNSLRHHGFEPTEIVIGIGERRKSLSQANAIFTKLLEEHLPRNAALLALGGGVVGDVTGFVAATYRRGIRIVHIPTTLLGQVESAIGGKTAVNHPLSKNAVGVFYQPTFVFSDIALLSTLPRREIICGLGEVLKYAMLSETMFSFIDRHLERIFLVDPDIIQELVLNCNRMKAQMVSEDEREINPTGGRAVLNLGHTIGHALEHLSNYKLHHGEAVLIGLKLELRIARATAIIGQDEFERIDSLLQRVEFNPDLSFIKRKLLLEVLFGKNRRPMFVLPKKIGNVLFTGDIGVSTVQAALKESIH